MGKRNDFDWIMCCMFCWSKVFVVSTCARDVGSKSKIYLALTSLVLVTLKHAPLLHCNLTMYLLDGIRLSCPFRTVVQYVVRNVQSHSCHVVTSQSHLSCHHLAVPSVQLLTCLTRPIWSIVPSWSHMSCCAVIIQSSDTVLRYST